MGRAVRSRGFHAAGSESRQAQNLPQGACYKEMHPSSSLDSRRQVFYLPLRLLLIACKSKFNKSCVHRAHFWFNPQQRTSNCFPIQLKLDAAFPFSWVWFKTRPLSHKSILVESILSRGQWPRYVIRLVCSPTGRTVWLCRPSQVYKRRASDWSGLFPGCPWLSNSDCTRM